MGFNLTRVGGLLGGTALPAALLAQAPAAVLEAKASPTISFQHFDGRGYTGPLETRELPPVQKSFNSWLDRNGGIETVGSELAKTYGKALEVLDLQVQRGDIPLSGEKLYQTTGTVATSPNMLPGVIGLDKWPVVTNGKRVYTVIPEVASSDPYSDIPMGIEFSPSDPGAGIEARLIRSNGDLGHPGSGRDGAPFCVRVPALAEEPVCNSLVTERGFRNDMDLQLEMREIDWRTVNGPHVDDVTKGIWGEPDNPRLEVQLGAPADTRIAANQ